MSSSRSAGARRAACAGAVLAILLVPPAHGADKKPAPPAAPTATQKTPLLSQEQLRDCMAQKDKLAQITEAAVKAQAAVGASKAEIDSSGKALEEQAATLDRTSEEAVNAYNAKVRDRNAKVDAYRAQAEAYNSQADHVLASKDAYDKACANRRYDDRDLSDIQKKK